MGGVSPIFPNPESIQDGVGITRYKNTDFARLKN